VDVVSFELAYAAAKETPGRRLTTGQAESLQQAVALYTSDLLEGWYQEWCLLERERLQQLYLMALDKLVAYSEVHGAFEAGLGYGAQILHYDRTREYTHCQLMRLYYLAGDRTGALRQYERCVAALKEEMDIEPAPETVELYQLVRANRPLDQPSPPTPPHSQPPSPGFHDPVVPSAGALADLAARLRRLRGSLIQLHDEIQQEIELVEQMLHQVNPGL
jgi:DNA-binding SARP family transcriptional activator